MNRRRVFHSIITAILIITLMSPSVCTAAAADSGSGSAGTEDFAYVPGEVIVSFTEDTSRGEMEAIIEDVADEPEVTELTGDSVVLETDATSDTMDMIEQLQENPEVEYAQPNYCYTPDSYSNDTYSRAGSSDSWYLDYMDVPEAWSAIEAFREDGTIPDTAARVRIATIDSGININHEDMAGISEGGNFDTEHCVTVLAEDESSSETADLTYPHKSITHGHSTASIIGSTSNNGKGTAGVAAGLHNDIAEVMAINVFRNESGFTSVHKATSADICAGIRYACENGARVIMMCLGHNSSYKDGYGQAIDDVALEEAINEATEEYDVVCVASAGNSNSTGSWYPSDFDACVSVINTTRYTDIDSSGCKYSSSNYGPEKDISAPGHNIRHAARSGGYSYSTGTSSSVASAAAVAGLVRYVNPDLTQEEVKNILYTTATDLYTAGWDKYTGYGNVNAYGAVTAAAGKPAASKTTLLSKPVAKAVSMSKSSIKITWNNVGASKYYIYRSTKSASGYTLVKTTTGTSWTNTGLTFGKKYYYKVLPKGTSSDGKRIDGSTSSAAGATVTCGTTTIKVKAKGKKKARVYWTKATNASGYAIYRSTRPDRGFKRVKTITKSSKGSTLITGLKSKKTYYYKIRAYRKKNGKKYYGSYTVVKACRQK
ncbi:MAG: S8 family serine peptidase [Clostridiales bacterium]|nr:S8 family serine peptidase [Clostridiales bacterium]